MYRTRGDCHGYFQVATGGADMMFDPTLKPWDICALVPVIEGARGPVTTIDGGNPCTETTCWRPAEPCTKTCWLRWRHGSSAQPEYASRPRCAAWGLLPLLHASIRHAIRRRRIASTWTCRSWHASRKFWGRLIFRCAKAAWMGRFNGKVSHVKNSILTMGKTTLARKFIESQERTIMTKPRVSNIAYTMGEIKGTYSEAPGFEAVVESESMLRIPEMWGWGNYFSTDDVFSLASPTIKETLDRAKIAPNEVDLVIFCASVMPGRGSDLNARTAKILKSVGINRANVIGQTLGGCATTLNSMIMACDLITARAYRNILVVSVEELPDEIARFTNFAIFSDVCVSFLVSSEENGGFEIVSSTYKTAVNEILDGADLQNADLNKESVTQTINKAAIGLADIKKVFSNNTFLPVKTLKERNIGFSVNQMDIGNVAEIGHCFSCDSILNYCLHKSSQPETSEGYFLLLAEADGHSASALIKETIA